MVLRNRPHYRGAPIVANPYRFLRTKRIEEFNHVRNAVFQRVIFVAHIQAGASVPTHVRCNGAEAEPCEHWKLMPPRDRKLRPAMHEDNRCGSRYPHARKKEVCRALFATCSRTGTVIALPHIRRVAEIAAFSWFLVVALTVDIATHRNSSRRIATIKLPAQDSSPVLVFGYPAPASPEHQAEPLIDA